MESSEVNSEIENKNNLSNEQDVVIEGKARVKLSNEDKSFSAFYNPAQVRKKNFIYFLGVQSRSLCSQYKHFFLLQ
jgi:hypothetical protein